MPSTSAIFDATLARNTDLACQLTVDHIERTLSVLRSSLEPNSGDPRCKAEIGGAVA